MEDLRERVEAVERALTDGNGELSALAEGAASADRVAELSNEVASLQEEVAELSAATQALRGYVGNVRSVNESVEERADAALAAVDSLEERVDDLEPATSPHARDWNHPGQPPRADASTRQQDSPTTDTDRTNGSMDPATCSACGRPSDSAAAPDGGRNHGVAQHSHTGHSPQADEALATEPASATRESLPGFDPNGSGGRVRVREERADPVQSDDGPVGDAEAGADPTLVDRMRELL